jgi:hypothetical protein
MAFGWQRWLMKHGLWAPDRAFYEEKPGWRGNELWFMDPRIEISGVHPATECMRCGRPARKGAPAVVSCSEGDMPETLLHRACGMGYTGEAIHAMYLTTLNSAARGEGGPLVNRG